MTGNGVVSFGGGFHCVEGSLGIPGSFFFELLQTEKTPALDAADHILPCDLAFEHDLSLNRCIELENRLRLTLGPSSGAAIPKMPTEHCMGSAVDGGMKHVGCGLSLSLGPYSEPTEALQAPRTLRAVRAARRAAEAKQFTGSTVALGLPRIGQDKVPRGRPRKHPCVLQETVKVKRGRGRPRKRRGKRLPAVLPDGPGVVSDKGI